MDWKIELVQEENGGGWHWIIVEYDNQAETWYNIGCGLEESYLIFMEGVPENSAPLSQARLIRSS